MAVACPSQPASQPAPSQADCQSHRLVSQLGQA